VGYFTLTGGVLGFITGYALAVFTTLQWSLIVGGKPVVGLIPYFIVGFEFTILFGVFGNIIGLLTQMRLPNFETMRYYDPRCSGEHFGIVVSCPEEDRQKAMGFFEEKGGEVRVFEEQATL
jgi:molybdopterin-containing oxidoreductase family membrane subunit